ncbi:Mob1/phocein [Mycena albidolilacea]|uniref:Mob1/phocein n=1 Tax=Mycena albidolilacea TaxID=1033008 RepID=A0AAD7F5S0_9AGAR|nr:Mob1/phocein [Mycena albidolilacea]
MSTFFNSIGRSMTRAPRNAKRSPTPTSATFPPEAQQIKGTPQQPPQPQKPLYLCSPFVEAALVKGNFKMLVMLPKYVDIMEWVAVNRLNYTWINQDRKHVHLPAPTYIDYVMTWVQNMLDDDNVFPTKSGQDFPPSFPSTVKHIYRQLLRVFAHIYHAHYAQILHLRSEPHFNSLFAHFLAFGSEFELLEMKDLRGSSSSPVGVGSLWERWKGMGILGG